MASKIINHSRLLKNHFFAVQKFGVIYRQSSDITKWNKDWKPGPYPRTEEERRLAAKKYNLIPEDYKPYPEEEGFGDYPNLEPVSAAARNPYEKFDYVHLKRNYGEPLTSKRLSIGKRAVEKITQAFGRISSSPSSGLHADFDLYLEDRLDVEQKHVFPLWGQALFVAGALATLVGLIYIGEYFPLEMPAAPKQMPYRGRAHYTFEPADS